MSTSTSRTEKFLAFAPGDSVQRAIDDLKKNKVEAAPVVDEDGRLLGVFSLTALMKNLLPVSVPVAGGIMMDVKISAAPGIAKRLAKVNTLTVGELMDHKVNAITPDTPIWETVNVLLQYGGPVVIVEPGTGIVRGVLTAESIMNELSKMND